MTTRKSIIMLDSIQTSETWIAVGDKVRSDTYFGYTDGSQTVSVQYNQFDGVFRLQGTLSNNPSEEDWFDIIVDEYINMSVEMPDGKNGVVGYQVNGNFLYLRAVMDRNPDAIEPFPQNQIEAQYGKIDTVLVAL